MLQSDSYNSLTLETSSVIFMDLGWEGRVRMRDDDDDWAMAVAVVRSEGELSIVGLAENWFLDRQPMREGYKGFPPNGQSTFHKRKKSSFCNNMLGMDRIDSHDTKVRWILIYIINKT